jgi:hypothetical protein
MLGRILLLLFLTIFLGTSASELPEYYCIQVKQNCTFKSVNISKDERVILRVNRTSESRFQETEINYVIFEDSSLYQIPHEIFETFPIIDKLELIKQNVHDIKTSFANAPSLKRFAFSYNNVECLESDIFKGDFFNTTHFNDFGP